MRDAGPFMWGAWSLRQLTAQKPYDCTECGDIILRRQLYWRRFGKMGEAINPFTARTCERCEAKWRR